MMNEEVLRAIDALINGELRGFMPPAQRISLVHLLRRSVEAVEIARCVNRCAERLAAMPKTYEQTHCGEQAIVHLHYFRGQVDAWILEKDVDGGVDQAFGLVSLFGTGIEGAETCYVSIRELVDNGVELDLHWTPLSLSALRSAQGSEGTACAPA